MGPSAANRRWLFECLQSVKNQTRLPDEVLLVDDSGDKAVDLLFEPVRHMALPINIRVWKSPWGLGVAHAFNCGVGEARHSLVFMLGSDDTLEPTCLEACYDEFMRTKDELAYYFVGVKYMDTGELQTVPCHAAMVTKRLWMHTGGLPKEAATGASDAALISILMAHGPAAGRLRPVRDAAPLYNYRRHAETDTAGKAAWQGVILQTRDLVTREWQPHA